MIERLHRAWIRRLRQEWRDINRERLDGRLRPPVFAIDDAMSRLGRWETEGRILGISEQHIWDDPWDRVLQTLRHEMAHQLVSELLAVDGQTDHGPAFSRACGMLGIPEDATARRAGGGEGRRILTKVRKLLALAASDNVHEAEAAMAAANTLLLRYNLELPAADDDEHYGHRQVGRSAAALPLHWKTIGSVLDEYFFVQCIWVGTYSARKDRFERRLEICGTHDNLDFAEYVHDFLHEACERLYRAERDRLRRRTRTSKREFMMGLLAGFRAKLDQERNHNAERGLIWVGDPRLESFYHERHPRIRRLSSGGVYHTPAYEAGEQAGRELTIHRPVTERGGTSRTRLLE